MSWGIKITILYCSFVALIITMVFMSVNQQVDMVTKNYYEQELVYQDRINIINRTKDLEEQIRWQIRGQDMTLTFPRSTRGKVNSGTVYFFRPSNEAFDKTITVAADTSLVRVIPVGGLEPGFYKLQINWRSGGQDYYNEFNIHL